MYLIGHLIPFNEHNSRNEKKRTIENVHSYPAEAFKHFKQLVGKWNATTEQGANAYLVYELVSNGSALHERFLDEGNPMTAIG